MSDQDKELKTNQEKVRFWLGEISAARKREKKYRETGRRILEIYNAKESDKVPFNILYSNTETLAPALYNSQPRPVVQRRFKDEDPLGKAASSAGQRVLEFHVDTNSEEYQTFDDCMGDVVLDALLPGKGATRLKYDATIVGQAPARYIKWELVCFESVKWDRWTHGFAKKWNRVPWIAFEHDVTEDEARELFGAKAVQLNYSAELKRVDVEDDSPDDDDNKTSEDIKVCKVWEVWRREDRKVFFISPAYQDDFLKLEDDPLGLTGFFPMPEPLRFLRKTNDLSATALYKLYENQAIELNTLTTRINKVAEAMKVRGAFNGQLDELERILKCDDGEMISLENVAAMEGQGGGKGLEGAIWLMPLAELITVLQQLYIARDNCKRVIYEITGVSDILRGASVASETATAQQIKNQWGTLRLKRLQRQVSSYARDMLRITLEIAAKRFQNEETWAKMTGLPYAKKQEVAAAQAQVAGVRSQMAMAGMLPPDPQAAQAAIAQAVPQAVAVLSKPAWEQVLGVLKDNTQRMYRIDIETNSTVDVEATEDQKLMGEVLTAVSQFIQGVSPLVISGSMPFEVAQSMLLGIVRRYRFGPEIEDYIKQMKPPTPPDQAKQQAERQKMEFELKKQQDEHGLKMRESEAKIEGEKEIAAVERQVKLEELQFKREELKMKKELLVAQTQAKIVTLNAQVAAAKAMPKKTGKETSNAPA